VARHVAKSFGLPYLLTLLGDDVTIYPHYHALSLALFRRAMTGAAAVTANGPALATLAEQLSGRPVEALSLGVDFSRFDTLPDKAEARRQLGLPEDKTIALYVGYQVPQKGMAELDQALRDISRPDLLTVCVGDGPERARLEANPAILCTGAQPGERIPLYMRAADLLLLPSHHEGLPTVVIEAGGAGLPVLGSDIGGITDLLGEGRGFIHRVKDADSLAAALSQCLDAPQERALRAQRLAEFVRAKHDVVGNCRRLMAIYQGVLSPCAA